VLARWSEALSWCADWELRPGVARRPRVRDVKRTVDGGVCLAWPWSAWPSGRKSFGHGIIELVIMLFRQELLVRGKVSLAPGVVARTASCRVLIRGGTDENTGELLPTVVVAQRVGWCAGLVRNRAARIMDEHWNAPDIAELAAGRPLPPVAAGGAAPPRVGRRPRVEVGRLPRCRVRVAGRPRPGHPQDPPGSTEDHLVGQ
jgi:hypothetical protein